MELRTAVEADLKAINAIYNHYVPTSTCTYALEEETECERLAWFHGRAAKHPVVVAEEQGEVIAWASLSAWKSRCGYTHSAEVSVYVRHDRHRRGIGMVLLKELIERGQAAGLHTLIAGVSADQTGSIALHEKAGFVRVACFKEAGYKFGQWLDVVCLQYML